MKWLLCVGLFLLFFTSKSQNAHVDSCLSMNVHDTLKIKCTHSFVEKNYRKDPTTCIEVLRVQLDLAENLGDLKNIEKTEGWLGYVLLTNGEYREALKVNFSCLNHRKELNDTKGVANALNNIGSTYNKMELYDSALWAYSSCVELMETIQDTGYLITGHNNIAGIYQKMGEMNKSIESWQRSIRLAETNQDSASLGTAYNGMAWVYNVNGKYDMAIVNYERAIDLFEKTGNTMSLVQAQNALASTFTNDGQNDKAIELFEIVKEFVTKRNILPGIASVGNNLGSLEFNRSNYPKALDYYLEAIPVYRKLNEKSGLAVALDGAALSYVKLAKPKQAIVLFQEAETVVSSTGAMNRLKAIYKHLGEAYYSVGEYKLASDYIIKHIDLRDSLLVDEQKKEIEELSAKFESEKKELEIANLTKGNQLLEKDKALKDSKLAEQASKIEAEAEANKRKDQQLLGIGILLFLALGLALLAFKGYRDKRQANQIISEQKNEVETQRDLAQRQKEIVEEKNKEITDSINYAQRLQQAILPNPGFIKMHLPDSFVLFKPKDIVAGDFYWIEELNGKVYFAAADCTGHGVPGAMVSVVCSNALNKSLMELGKHKPNEILESTRQLVVETFSKSGEDVKDGMDISLAVWDKSTNELSWAGANNPLWILREKKPERTFQMNNERYKLVANENEDVELLEVKADKQPVGKDDRNAPFTTQSLQLYKGDLIYLFSDGFQDQFGGDKGKKFKASNMRKLFFNNFGKSMDDQCKSIESAFINWMANFEQLDDVCIVAVRV